MKKIKEDAPVNATGAPVANFDPLMSAPKKQKPMKRKMLELIQQGAKKG